MDKLDSTQTGHEGNPVAADETVDFQKHLDNPEIIQGSVRTAISQALDLSRPDSFMASQRLIPDLDYSKINLSEPVKQRLRKVQEILHNPELDKLISEGKLTAAMIKPNVHMGKIDGTDSFVADRILDDIDTKSPLKVVFSLPVAFNIHFLEQFYAEAKSKYSSIPDPDSDMGSIYQRLVNFMQDGATNLVLLYSEGGDAISKWRNHIGPTNPTKDASGTSLRARFASSIKNNMVHGSDSIENARFEIGVFRDLVDELLKSPNIEKGDILEESLLRSLGVLLEDEVFLSCHRFLSPQLPINNRIIKSRFTGYIVTYLDTKTGEVGHKRFTAKTTIDDKDGIDRQTLSNTEVDRIKICGELLKRFPQIGIILPKVYSSCKDTDGNPCVIRDYAPDETDFLHFLTRLSEMPTDAKMQIIDPLIRIAAFLDINGVPSKVLTASFFFDGSKFWYTGSDNIKFDKMDPSSESESAFADIITTFGKDESFNSAMRNNYRAHKNQIEQQILRTQNPPRESV